LNRLLAAAATRQATRAALVVLSVVLLVVTAGAGDPQPTPRLPFDSADAQFSVLPLDKPSRDRRDRGMALFNTDHVVAGTPDAEDLDGLGPVFNAASCDACHNSGHRTRGPLRDGPLPVGLVVQLGGTLSVYGEVLNAQALPGIAVEARSTVRFVVRDGRYPDGRSWQLREPRLIIDTLAQGPLPADTVLRPRIAPPVFGAGLIDAAVLPAGQGRFGWSATVATLAEQTAVAYAHEMGMTSRLRAHDDCAAVDARCREAPGGGTPEVADTDFDAVIAFQRALPVPAEAPLPAADEAGGRRLFERVGCVACHAASTTISGIPGLDRVTMWSDLRRHDLGDGLADRTIAGRAHPTRFRTAPLWGLAAARAKAPLALLHDGRADTVEQAVLWHDGEARDVRRRYETLSAADRARLLTWVEAR
jgi:CxxC motif-containing protein (DUF1111 family)